MINLVSRLTPSAIILMFALVALASTALSVVLATGGPQVDLPRGAVPIAVGDVVLQENDLISEPDHLGQYDKLRAFFARQDLILTQLQGQQVAISFATPDGGDQAETLTIRNRSVLDLPFAFWFQQAVGFIALLTAGWVIALRRKDWGARMFALTGVFLALSAAAASIYSTRQFALPGDFFRVLSSVNHIGAGMFGIALVGLFLMYPRQLVRPVWLWVPALFFGAGIVLEVSYVPVGDLLWTNIVIGLELLLAIVFAAIQWWRTRGDLVDRAGLRWFFLFSLVGCSLFIGLSAMPSQLGLASEGFVPQAYAFGFFNLMHIGLALGVIRWRVFELDRYAYFVWLWLAGAILIFVTDLVLLLWLREQPWASLSLALILGGFLYFPIRQLLLVRLFAGKTPQVLDLTPEVIDVALAPTRRLQDTRWDDLLQQVFAPAAKIEHLIDAPAHPRISENGVALQLPALSGTAGRQLRYPAAGRRLFNSADVKAATTLTRMHGVVSESHLAYERGVKVERDRISRDVHDNIGAQLLTALHTIEKSHKDALLRDALTDMRQIISDGFRSNALLEDVIADLRAEMADRLDLHGIKLDWPANLLDALPDAANSQIPFLIVNTMRSILREVTSNVIKHAKAQTVEVKLTSIGDMLSLQIRDDGVGFDITKVSRGAGLNNMTERLNAVGGDISFTGSEGETTISVNLPLDLYMRSELAEAAQ